MNRFRAALNALLGRTIQSGSITIEGDTRRALNSWLISGLSADGEIYQNLRPARAKCRAMDGGREPNEYVRKFLSELLNNTIGSDGVVLQMKVLETTDRVVYSTEEKEFLRDHQAKINDRRAQIVKRLRKRFPDWSIPNPEPFECFHKAESGLVYVQRGTPDIYACNVIEAGVKEWSKKENCTVTKQLAFHDVENLSLRGTARDGEAIVRMVSGFLNNPFGFALQLIDPDWLDINFNATFSNGNRVVMGVEFNEWNEPVAFHILTQDNRPAWSAVGGYLTAYVSDKRERIEAKDIVHLFVKERVDQTRGVPWFMAVIERLRKLGKYEEAELLASIGAACKTVNYYNEIDATAEMPPGVEVEPESGEFVDRLTPGGVHVSKWGWKMQLIDPTHPNGNYGDYRKGVLRGVAAGLPGSTYYGISQDLEAVNFSSMQGGDRESREAYMMIQNWLISGLHAPIFPRLLEAGLMSGQIPLPISKFDKFNKPSWHGRRWRAIDPIKDITAKILAVENGFTSRQRVIAEMSGNDYEEIMLELAYEDTFEDGLGLIFGSELKAAQAGQIYAASDGTEEGEQQAAEKVIATLAGRMLASRRKSQPVNGNGLHR